MCNWRFEPAKDSTMHGGINSFRFSRNYEANASGMARNYCTPVTDSWKMSDEQMYGHYQNHYSSQGLKHSLQNF